MAILIYLSHLLLGLSSRLIASGFLTKTLHTFLFYFMCVCHMSHHPIILVFYHLAYKYCSSFLCNFLGDPC